MYERAGNKYVRQRGETTAKGHDTTRQTEHNKEGGELYVGMYVCMYELRVPYRNVM